ncbi:hypothetical protein LOTGIDRAFT_138054, partial [Lottia gigantea]
KVELHVHLDGAIRSDTIFDIAQRRKIQIPAKTKEELRQQLQMKEANLDTLLEYFRTFMPVVAGSREAVYQLAYEFCEDCAKHKIKYVEARYSPHLLANSCEKPFYSLERGSFTPREVVTTVNEAFEKGSQDFNVDVKSILCCIRTNSEFSMEVAQLCRDFRSDGVVAIDIAGPEFILGNDKGNSPHKLAYMDAYQNGIHRTAHAGEVTPPGSVLEAIDDLHAERIGHGYTCLKDESLYQRIKKERIHLETCPISSMMTGLALAHTKINHPISKFANDEVNFSLNTDDPLVLGNNISEDYKVAMEMGLSRDQITQSIFNAARSSFTSDKEKASLIKELIRVYGQY